MSPKTSSATDNPGIVDAPPPTLQSVVEDYFFRAGDFPDLKDDLWKIYLCTLNGVPYDDCEERHDMAFTFKMLIDFLGKLNDQLTKGGIA